jgi:aryl-alcohol dehydrogenase-like predicted oxidoreductase
MTSMRTTELGRTGEQVSALALGCMGMGTLADEATSFATLDAYAEDGGSFLDTANAYAWFYARGTAGGQSEELLGRWLRRTGRRDTTFIATKGAGGVLNPDQAWAAGEGSSPNWGVARFEGAGAPALRDALEGSLRRLGTDHIDLYYVHVDDRAAALEETLSTLAGFVAEGKVRHLGWSNIRTWRLERIRALCAANGWPEPVALQQQDTYLRVRARMDVSLVGEEQLDYLRDRDGALTLVAYSPLLKGLYDVPPAQREQALAANPFAGPESLPRLEVLDAVAAEAGAQPGQVVLAWLAARSPRTVPLIGTTKVERYRQARDAMDLKLTPEQQGRLDAA